MMPDWKFAEGSQPVGLLSGNMLNKPTSCSSSMMSMINFWDGLVSSEDEDNMIPL